MNLCEVVAKREEFDEVIDKILSSPKYWRFNNNIGEKTKSWFDRFQEWIESLLDSKMSSQTGDISSILSIVVVIIVGITLVVALILLCRYIYQCIKGRGRLKEILVEKITEETTPLTLRKKAQQYEEQMAYRLSIRYYYIALLLYMHESGILFLKNAMTNSEIYNSLMEDKYQGLSVFKEVMDIFNETWYGWHVCEGERYIQYKSNVDKLWNEVMTHEKKQK